jgi:hypothetical protein
MPIRVLKKDKKEDQKEDQKEKSKGSSILNIFKSYGKYDGKPVELKRGGLSAKQKKIAAKAPPPDKIDAKDFAVLKAEKAKGRGMGLQDESIKPGKVMKAKTGKQIVKEFKASLKGIDESFKDKVHPMKKQRLLDRSTVMTKAKYGKMMKARYGKAVKTELKADPTKPISSVAPKASDVLKKKKLPGRVGTALGIASMMVPAAYAAAKQYKDYKTAKNRDEAKVKKMAGGMAKKYSEGMSYKDMAPYGGKYAKKKNEMKATASENVKRLTTQPDAYDPEARYLVGEKKKRNSTIQTIRKTTDQVNLKEAASKLKEQAGPGFNVSINTKADLIEKRLIRPKRMAGRMGGGMMQKPMGYKSGTMVKARGCKLGRTRPTKMY